MNQPIPYEEQLAHMAGFGSAAERQIYDNQQVQNAYLKAIGYNVAPSGLTTPIISPPQPVVTPVPDVTPIQSIQTQISQQTVPRTTPTSSSPGLSLPSLGSIPPSYLLIGAGAILLILLIK